MDLVAVIQCLGITNAAIYSREFGLKNIWKKVHSTFCKIVTKGTERCFYKLHFEQLIIEVKYIV